MEYEREKKRWYVRKSFAWENFIRDFENAAARKAKINRPNDTMFIQSSWKKK